MNGNMPRIRSHMFVVQIDLSFSTHALTRTPKPMFQVHICHKYLYTRPCKPTVEWTTMAQERRATRTNGKQPARKRTAKCWWRSNWIKESLCTVNSMWQAKNCKTEKLNVEEKFLSWHAKWCGNVENPVHSLMRWRLVVLRHVTRQTHPQTDTHSRGFT